MPRLSLGHLLLLTCTSVVARLVLIYTSVVSLAVFTILTYYWAALAIDLLVTIQLC
jgi:hypothetical protein